MPRAQGAIRLFTIFGISVFVHWSWFLVALYEVDRTKQYSSVWWSVLEYVAIFAIVTLHEFGHALACRQVGGVANQIVLWPLGGVAYVSPPPRPGATLWSIVAGPLVNLALIPVLLVTLFLSRPISPSPNFTLFIQQLNLINVILLVFNIIPIYPLDGGKILRSVLWFFVGRAQSLMATTIVGFVGVAGMAARIVDDVQAFRREGLGQLLDDEVVHSPCHQGRLKHFAPGWKDGRSNECGRQRHSLSLSRLERGCDASA